MARQALRALWRQFDNRRSNPYTQAFFEGQSRGSNRSADAVVPCLHEMIKPTSVLDVGCGVGHWLGVFMSRGITDVVGVDGDYINRSLLNIPREKFIGANLAEPVDLGRRFDLAMSLEVAEHLPPEAADTIVDTLAGRSDVVFFSAAVPRQRGKWPPQ